MGTEGIDTEGIDTAPIDVDQMVRDYAACALWSSSDTRCAFGDAGCDAAGRPADQQCQTCSVGGPFLDAEFDVEDIAPDTLAAMRADCVDFAQSNAADLVDGDGVPMDAGQAGHDFWLTRNGHGAGFWDRGLGDRGERLAEAARVYGSVDLWVGDDGKIHHG